MGEDQKKQKFLYINTQQIDRLVQMCRAWFDKDKIFHKESHEKILSKPSFGGEVKPSVPCRRFAARKRSLNGVEVVISAKLPDNILAHSSHFRRCDLSRRGGRGGTWWRKWERLNAGKAMANYP